MMLQLAETNDPRWRYRSGDQEHFPFKVWAKLRSLRSQQRRAEETLARLTVERQQYEAALAVWEKLGPDVQADG
jgi:hypothetical protein